MLQPHLGSRQRYKFWSPVPDLLNLWDGAQQSVETRPRGARSTRRAAGQGPALRSTRREPSSALGGPHSARLRPGSDYGPRDGGRGKERARAGSAPADPQPPSRGRGGRCEPRLAPLKLPLTWSLGGETTPAHQTAPSSARLSDACPPPPDRSTGQRLGANQGRKAGRAEAARGRAGAAPLNVWIRPPRLHGSTQNARKSAGS